MVLQGSMCLMIKQDWFNISSLSILDINVFFVLCWPAAWCCPKRGEQDILDICHPPSQRATSDSKTQNPDIHIFFFWKGKVYTNTSTNRDSSGNCKTGRGNLEYQIFNLVSQHLKRFSWTLQSRQSWRALLLKAPWCLWTCHQEQQFRSVLCNPKNTTTLILRPLRCRHIVIK